MTPHTAIIWTDAALSSLFEEFSATHSLQAVATARKTTRQHIHQLLRKGMARGLFRYRSSRTRYRRQRRTLLTRTAESLISAAPRATRLQHLARRYRMSVGLFTQMLSPATRSRVKAMLHHRRTERMQRCLLRRYQQLSRRLGHPPSLYEIQVHSTSLAAGIIRHWKTRDTFYQVHALPSPTPRSAKIAAYHETVTQQLLQALHKQPLAAAGLRGRVAPRLIKEWLKSGRITAQRIGHTLYYHPTPARPMAA